MKKLFVAALTLFVFAAQEAPAQTRRTRPLYTPSDMDTRWSDRHSPWDFSALLGLYNPGFGFSGRAAYRILDDILGDVDDSLSIESGVGFVFVSDSVGGQSYSTTIFELPVMGRWDFRIPHSKFILGPQLGLSLLTGGTQTINGVNYSTRGGTVYLELGGVARYDLNEVWGLRFDFAFGGFTVLHFGATYSL